MYTNVISEVMMIRLIQLWIYPRDIEVGGGAAITILIDEV